MTTRDNIENVSSQCQCIRAMREIGGQQVSSGAFCVFGVFSGFCFPIRSPFAKRSDFGPILDRFSRIFSMNPIPATLASRGMF